MTLKSALKTLATESPDLLLSDGATTFDLPNLTETLRDDGEDMDRDVFLGRLSDGQRAIYAVNANGEICSGEPLYRQAAA